MNKFRYFAALVCGTMMLTGCSNEEVLATYEAPTQAIGFKAMANKSGRADGEVTSTNITRFRVFGCSQETGGANHLTLFNNVTVSRLNSESPWEYSPIQYWTPNRDYYFVAISTNNMSPVWEYSVPDTHSAELSTANFLGYGTVKTGISEVNAERDLVYAYAARTTDAQVTDTRKVAFTFHHMLSQIGLTFKNTFANAQYSFSISNVKLSGLIAEGSVNLGVTPADLQWQPASDTKTGINVTVPSNNNVTTTVPVTSEYRYIIPGVQELGIEFNVTVKLNGTIYSQRTMNGTITLAEGYKPGQSYMITASVNEKNIIPSGAKPIEFTVEGVDEWQSDETGNVNFPKNP